MNDRFEFADISGIVVIHELLQRLRIDARMGRAGVFSDEALCQQWNVLFAFPQGREVYPAPPEPVVQVSAEEVLAHQTVHIRVGGRDEAHIDPAEGGGADFHELAFLQHSEQFSLKVGRHIGDFIQKNRPPVGGFQIAGVVVFGPVNAPFLWPKNSASNRVAVSDPMLRGIKAKQ